VDVVRLSMALLSFRGFDTPSLPAQGEQRRSSFFNIRRDIGITEAAPPLMPSSPKSILVLALSGLSGAILGIGAGLLLDGLDRTFRARGQVSHELEADCIAVIPALAVLTQLRPKGKRCYAPSGTRMIAPEQSPIWAIHTLSSPDLREGFCGISAAIQSLNHRGKRNQVIGITSAQSKEGKSTIAAGISETMASIGARVILVDCDLRNPWLSSTLTPAPERGLFDVISGVASIEDVTWTDPITGLVFIPAVEKARPERTNTLPSNSLRQLLGDLRKAYDYVIVDLPTMIQLADIRAVTGEVDSFILVIEWGKTHINLVKRAVSVSRVAYENTLGIVLNKADINTLGRYDSYYPISSFGETLANWGERTQSGDVGIHWRGIQCFDIGWKKRKPGLKQLLVRTKLHLLSSSQGGLQWWKRKRKT
jgi:polysaccharide biosynthesis transport protein